MCCFEMRIDVFQWHIGFFLITNISTSPPQYFVVIVVLRVGWKLLASSSNLLLVVRDIN